LLFGLVWVYAEDRDWVSENMRLLVLTGFLGSCTTFWTLAFDEAMFIRNGIWAVFVANLPISNATALAVVFVGWEGDLALNQANWKTSEISTKMHPKMSLFT